MSKSAVLVLSYPVRLWDRLFRFLTERNETAVAAWGSALQYKRRYTNPEAAMRARQDV